MSQLFLFDVDGTVVRPQRVMDASMADCLRRLAAERSICFVTGSDVAKLEKQVPNDLLDAAFASFTCGGSEMWQGGVLVHAFHHDFSEAMIGFVKELMAASDYPVRTGRHVELRTGALNISVVGRAATIAQRGAYARHDRRTGERDRLIAAVTERFPEYEASRGGQISIDIAPRGWNKSRVHGAIRSRLPGVRIVFFGDRISRNGNDWPLAQALSAEGSGHCVHAVARPAETRSLLERLYLGAEGRAGSFKEAAAVERAASVGDLPRIATPV